MAQTVETGVKSISSKRVVRSAGKPAVEQRTALNMRIQTELRDLIDRAAEATGKNRTDFVLDAARQAAQSALLDRVHVQMNPKAYAQFLQRLDSPPQVDARLRKTMQAVPAWA